MIYGVIASEDAFAQSGQPSGPVPSGQMDFMAGSYDWGGTSLIASDIVDQTGWIGANGLAVPGSASAGAELLYSAMTTLLASCNFTVVFEVETLNTSSADVLTVSNAGNGFYIQLTAHAGSDYQMQDYGGVARYADDITHGLTTGIHKIAATTAPDRVSISIDGAAVVTDTTTSTVPVVGFPMTNFYLGGWDSYTDAAIRIRSFNIYAAQDDADLPGLSVQ